MYEDGRHEGHAPAHDAAESGGEEEGVGAHRQHAGKSWADEEEELPAIGFCAPCACGGLSCLSWAFLVFLLCIVIRIVVHNPQDAALLPGFFVAPMLVLYVFYWRKLRHQIPVDLVLQVCRHVRII
jgi:hypothetical protein